jgi:hypothetical protein
MMLQQEHDQRHNHCGKKGVLHHASLACGTGTQCATEESHGLCSASSQCGCTVTDHHAPLRHLATRLLLQRHITGEKHSVAHIRLRQPVFWQVHCLAFSMSWPDSTVSTANPCVTEWTPSNALSALRAAQTASVGDQGCPSGTHSPSASKLSNSKHNKKIQTGTKGMHCCSISTTESKQEPFQKQLRPAEHAHCATVLSPRRILCIYSLHPLPWRKVAI